MAAPAAAPKLCNVLSPLDATTMRLIREALPIAQELYEADNLRFDPLRAELLSLYGDDAAPQLREPRLLDVAMKARDARLVDESFVLALVKLMAAAKASDLRAPATRVPTARAQHEALICQLTADFEDQLGLDATESRSRYEQHDPSRSHWSSTLENLALPVAGTHGLLTAVTALTMLIAELGHSYKLKLGESLREEELIATMAMLEVSFVGAGASDTCRYTAMRWLQVRAQDQGWSISLREEGFQQRAESHSAGLDGYGRTAIANLRDFRSPVQLIAYKSFAGTGVLNSRALHPVRLQLCYHLRCCMSLATYAHKEGCGLLTEE